MKRRNRPQPNSQVVEQVLRQQRKDLSPRKRWIQQTFASWTSEFCLRKLHPIRDYLKFTKTFTPSVVFRIGVVREFNQIEPLKSNWSTSRILVFFKASCFGISLLSLTFSLFILSFLLQLATFLYRRLTRPNATPITYYALLLSSPSILWFWSEASRRTRARIITREWERMIRPRPVEFREITENRGPFTPGEWVQSRKNV